MGEAESSYKHLEKKKKKNPNIKSGKRHFKKSEEGSSRKESIKRFKNKKQREGREVSFREETLAGSSKLGPENAIKVPSKHHEPSGRQASMLRKKVDPETMQYFTVIANQFLNNEIDMDERPTICGKALEETRGKEIELVTDMVISHTIQNLLEGCDLDQLCRFLRNCGSGFSAIATDKFGSHVAETALKSLSRHLEEEGSYPYIEESLKKLCQVVVTDAINIMYSRCGSHVLRSLLCICKGVPFDSLEEFHATKRATLAERLSNKSTQLSQKDLGNVSYGFPNVFMYLVRELLNHARDEIKVLRVNQYSSYVLQAAMKLLVGDDEELEHIILVVLGYHEKNFGEDEPVSDQKREEIMALLEDTASSHLLEVIIEVAPDHLYDKLLTEVFDGSLLEMSFHQCGNFVLQALASSARRKEQLDVIWNQLGTKFKEILEQGKPGVIASTLAACQRLQVHEYESCQALAVAASSSSEAPGSIIPHILFLDSYFRDRSDWKWPPGGKMHVLGCLMLQSIFKYPKKYIEPYTKSISSMDSDCIFQTAKDAGGARVIEAVLSSDISADQKLEIIAKLQGRFGDLALNASSSFTIEKCFSVSKISLKEAIAAELIDVQAELSKKRHGPYLLKKIDIDGFANRPEHWRRHQLSKENVYKEFQTVFGSGSSCNGNQMAYESSKKSSRDRHKRCERANADDTTKNHNSGLPGLGLSMTKLGFPSEKIVNKRDPGFNSKNFIRSNPNSKTPFLRTTGKRKSSMDELADLAGKSRLSSGDVRKLFRPEINNVDEQSGKERVPFLKKQKR